MRRLVPVGTVLLALVTLAAACGPDQPDFLSSVNELQPKTEKASDFEFVAYQGAEVLGREELLFSEILAQGKPVVLNFWAGNCPPCRLEMPHLDEVARAYQDRALVLGLDVGPFTGLGSQEDGRVLLEDLGVRLPAGTTADARVVRDYQLMGMPTTFFIKSDGEIARQWTGILSREKLEQLVEELLAAST